MARRRFATAAEEAAHLGLTPVAIGDVTVLCGRSRAAGNNWTNRGVLPPAPWTVGGRPAWPTRIIVDWASEGGYWAAGPVPTFPPLTDPLGEAEARNLTPVGRSEGAASLGISVGAIEKWQARGTLVAPDWRLSGRLPAWAWRTWVTMAEANGYEFA